MKLNVKNLTLLLERETEILKTSNFIIVYRYDNDLADYIFNVSYFDENLRNESVTNDIIKLTLKNIHYYEIRCF